MDDGDKRLDAEDINWCNFIRHNFHHWICCRVQYSPLRYNKTAMLRPMPRNGCIVHIFFKCYNGTTRRLYVVVLNLLTQWICSFKSEVAHYRAKRLRDGCTQQSCLWSAFCNFFGIDVRATKVCREYIDQRHATHCPQYSFIWRTFTTNLVISVIISKHWPLFIHFIQLKLTSARYVKRERIRFLTNNLSF